MIEITNISKAYGDKIAVSDLDLQVREHADRGNTVFFSTHILDVAEKLCDRVGIIMNGSLVACGTLDHIRSEQGQSLESVFMQMLTIGMGLILAFFGGSGSSLFAATYSKDGRRLWLEKSLPVDLFTIFKSKLLASMLLTSAGKLSQGLGEVVV